MTDMGPNKLRFLFYFIHPSKYHSFRVVINTLRQRGHAVEVAIISKDITESLVKAEGWEYTNIFPEGRRIPHLHTYISAAINLIRTLFRLFKFMSRKKYDLIVTDDLATIVGRIKGIPSVFFTDDDLKAVPESVILIATASYILCPSVAYMGRYSDKKIGYKALKSLAHLHPNHFQPDRSLLDHSLHSAEKDFFLIRCVSVTSTHDVGKKGLTDEILIKIVDLLKPYGDVVINSQRPLPQDLKKYELNVNKMHISQYLYFAKLFISDSTTMCAEAAVLGTPAIEIDDWYADFEQYKLLHNDYGLLYGFSSEDESEILKRINDLMVMDNLESVFAKKREEFIKNQIDLSAFMVWMFENYPRSVNDFQKDANLQDRFR
jgi:predicted glycosyltransferase